MRTKDIVWTTALIASAILLTAFISTASVGAEGTGGVADPAKASQIARGKYLVDVQSVTKVEGMAFLADEVEGIIDSALDGTLGDKEIEKAKFARLAAATVEAPAADASVGANA